MWRQRRRVNALKKELMNHQPTAPCCHCGKHFKRRALTLDHIVPKSDGGKYERGNVLLSCNTCNEDRGTEDFVQYNTRKRAEQGLEPLPILVQGLGP